MYRVVHCMVFMALVACGTPALADEAIPQPNMTQSQLMQDCIERQKASNVAMSKAAMKSFCKDQMKQQKHSGAFPEAPPTDTPRN
jgi:hypothetical protein